MDKIKLTTKQLEELNNGQSVHVEYSTCVDAMIGQFELCQIQLLPPIKN